VPAPLRAVTGRLRAASHERRRVSYREFVERVEPELAAHPRAHRFAVPPLVGAPGTPAAALAVCIAPGGGGDAQATRESLQSQTAAPAHVLEGTPTEALTETWAPWLVLLRAGDRLAPDALLRLGQAVTLAPDAAVVTCDSDVMGRGGQRSAPRLGPGPSPDGVLATDQAGPPVLVAREPALEAEAAPGPAWELELLLALAGPTAAGHAHVPQVLVHRTRRPPADQELLAAVAQRVLHARGETSATVEAAPPGGRRVRRAVSGEPSVEVIVCFRDQARLLERCTRSVLERSSYERLTLRLVDNHSSQPSLLTLLQELERHPQVAVDRDDAPFNFSQLNNRAARASGADFLVFLNNDTEVVTSTWIEELLEEAQREEVGAVGPLLIYPNGRVQHAGAALGLHGYAGHPFAGLDPGRRTPFGAAADGTRNWMAVTAACLMVERRKLEAVGGFDESFVIGGNDVDLGLRLTAAGHRSLCVPHVRLLHDESGSRDPLDIPPGDFERSRERYGRFRTVGDPFYNPNLTLHDTTCGLRSPQELDR
jgi:GT2 family glycosyltransferase